VFLVNSITKFLELHWTCSVFEIPLNTLKTRFFESKGLVTLKKPLLMGFKFQTPVHIIASQKTGNFLKTQIPVNLNFGKYYEKFQI
jgi:hypothetical protein